MHLDLETAGRDAVQRNRHAPQEPVKVLAGFEGSHPLDGRVATGPVDLTLEATDADGELAPWLNDDWWTSAIRQWADARVTVMNSATPAALLHPIILYQLEMLRRVVPHWRLVAYAYPSDLSHDDDFSALVTSPYHEVRFIDQLRPGVPQADRYATRLSLGELFGAIRQEQADRGISTPILVRVPPDRTVPGVRSFPRENAGTPRSCSRSGAEEAS